MIIRFECNFAARPDVVWPYLTWPDRMNKWSEARVELIAAGEGGRPDGTGTTRWVIVPVLGTRSRLLEVVEESRFPSRFVYRVVAGGGLRQHRGQMHLEPIGEGTRLVWEVAFRTYVPGLGLLMKWLLKRSVGRSLVALDRLLRGQPNASMQLPQLPCE